MLYYKGKLERAELCWECFPDTNTLVASSEFCVIFPSWFELLSRERKAWQCRSWQHLRFQYLSSRLITAQYILLILIIFSLERNIYPDDFLGVQSSCPRIQCCIFLRWTRNKNLIIITFPLSWPSLIFFRLILPSYVFSWVVRSKYCLLQRHSDGIAICSSVMTNFPFPSDSVWQLLLSFLVLLTFST